MASLTSSASGGGGGGGGVAHWEFADDRGWRALDPGASAALERAYGAGQRVATFVPQGLSAHRHTYDVDFAQMQQTNRATGFQRRVRRCVTSGGAAAGGAAASAASSVFRKRKSPGAAVVRSVVWEWEERGRWTPYDAASSVVLENALTAGTSSAVQLQFGRTRYNVDVSALTQTNTSTGYRRQIRRRTAGGVHSAGAATAGAGHISSSSSSSSSPTIIHFQAVDSPDWAAITQWTPVRPPAYDPSEKDLMDEPLGPGGEDSPVVRLSCDTESIRCIFRVEFINQALSASACCPHCKFTFCVPGPQPSGALQVSTLPHQHCSGHPGAGTISLSYRFPSGTQGPRMLRPGLAFHGTSRTAYLPNTSAGQAVCALLQKAFVQGELFVVGDSVTTGQQNTTIWSGIHQKTSLTGGASRHGWPDPSYFDRVKQECGARGVFSDAHERDERETRRKEATAARKEKEAAATAGGAASSSREAATAAVGAAAGDGVSTGGSSGGGDLEASIAELSRQIEVKSGQLRLAMQARDTSQIRTLMQARKLLMEQRSALQGDLDA
jgi:deltex-like protein